MPCEHGVIGWCCECVFLRMSIGTVPVKTPNPDMKKIKCCVCESGTGDHQCYNCRRNPPYN